jgi:malate synthase
VLDLPKIQTAGEAALRNDMLTELETHLGLDEGTVKVDMPVEQLEASYPLMDLGPPRQPDWCTKTERRWRI